MPNYRTINIDRYTRVFSALSNENRLRIFLKLVSCCDFQLKDCESKICRCVSEIGEDLGIAQSTVSHHLKELRVAGLIKMKRRGQKIDCWIDQNTLRDLVAFFSQNR